MPLVPQRLSDATLSFPPPGSAASLCPLGSFDAVAGPDEVNVKHKLNESTPPNTNISKDSLDIELESGVLHWVVSGQDSFECIHTVIYFSCSSGAKLKGRRIFVREIDDPGFEIGAFSFLMKIKVLLLYLRHSDFKKKLISSHDRATDFHIKGK